jgi:mono/diheme cytochrome c family protein
MRSKFVLLFSMLIFCSCSSETIVKSHEGKILYQKHCEACHGNMGQGFEDLYPPLSGADYFIASPLAAACYMRNGLQGKIRVNQKEYEMEMPAFPQLSAIEITNILNYIGNQWGNRLGYISPAQVNEKLKTCQN